MMTGVDSGLDRMLTIARTEQIRVYREGSLGTYRQSGLVSGFRRLSARQERTCIACLIDDGTFYEVADEFEDHINGRCMIVPVQFGQEDNPLGRETGREWFEKLDEDTQARIMGQGKFEAWKNGEFGLDDLVKRTPNETWGASIGAKSLAELTQ
jgi:hypothetical protein